MKPLALVILLLSPLIFAWSAEDHEIFRLNDELHSLESANTTFYSFLNVPSSATIDDISKAYRSKSRQLHPDKAINAAVSKLNAQRAKAAGKKGKTSSKGVTKKEHDKITKDANERYKRLPTIAGILRDHRRERYDYFLKNGFPIWRGTGYYYERFRPGLGSVLAGLMLLFGGGMHYGAMYIGWKRHREFVERYISHARRTAWGDESGVPGLSDALNGTAAQGQAPTPPPELEQDTGAALNRKQKRMQERESKREKSKPAKSLKSSRISRPVEAEPIGQNPQGARKKVVAENGKVLIVDVEGNVFLEEETADGEKHELLLDVSIFYNCASELIVAYAYCSQTRFPDQPSSKPYFFASQSWHIQRPWAGFWAPNLGPIRTRNCWRNRT